MPGRRAKAAPPLCRCQYGDRRALRVYCRSRSSPRARCCYVGEPVALIIAESRDQALDAAERVAVDYVPLPAVTTGRRREPPARRGCRWRVPGNLCFEWHAGDHDAVAARAFASRGNMVVSLSVDNHPRRHKSDGSPRGVIGDYDPASGRYTRAHVSAQSFHATRDHAARALGASKPNATAL